MRNATRLIRAVQGKNALVTGGASGIGYALGNRLARAGCRVVLADRDAERCAAAAATLVDRGLDVTAMTLDVTDPAAVETAVRRCVHTHGTLDYVFNNAGLPLVGELRARRVDELEHILRVNLHGVVYGTHAAMRVMAEQGGGHIVNTGSMAGLVAKPGAAIYSASKFGVVGFSLAARAEGRGLGVRVSVVCPGFVSTPMLETIEAGSGRRQTRNPQSPDEAARAILAGVVRNRSVILTPRRWRLVWWLTRLSPGLVDVLAARMADQIRQRPEPAAELARSASAR